jgi:hypothetical protein
MRIRYSGTATRSPADPAISSMIFIVTSPLAPRADDPALTILGYRRRVKKLAAQSALISAAGLGTSPENHQTTRKICGPRQTSDRHQSRWRSRSPIRLQFRSTFRGVKTAQNCRGWHDAELVVFGLTLRSATASFSQMRVFPMAAAMVPTPRLRRPKAE